MIDLTRSTVAPHQLLLDIHSGIKRAFIFHGSVAVAAVRLWLWLWLCP
ncbi:hypothetical protein [Streptomyces sp. 3N207]